MYNITILAIAYIYFSSIGAISIFFMLLIPYTALQYGYYINEIKKRGTSNIFLTADKPIIYFLIIALGIILASRWGILYTPSIKTYILLIILAICAYIWFLSHRIRRENELDNTKEISDIRERIILVLIIVGAIAIRIIALKNENIGVDPLFHLKSAKEILNLQPITYTRSLLYTYIIAAFQFFFGTSIKTTLYFNIFIQIGGYYIFYKIFKSFFSTRIALITIFLLAVSPFSIWMSQMIRMYNLFQILFILLTFQVYKLITKNINLLQIIHKKVSRNFIKCAVITLFLFIVTFHTHPLALSLGPPVTILIGLKAIIEIGSEIKTSKLSNLILRSKNILYIIVLLSLGLILNKLLNNIFSNVINIEFAELPHSLNNYYDIIIRELPKLLTIFFLAITIGYSAYSSKQKKILIYLQVVFYGILLQSIFIFTAIAPRYIFHILPILFLLVAVGIDAFLRYIFRAFLETFNWNIGKKQMAHMLISVLLIVSIVNFQGLKEVYAWKGTGENPIHEFTYPFQQIPKVINLEAEDYLLSLNEGLWETIQEKSKYIVNISTINKTVLRSKEEAVNAFFNAIVEGTKGYYSTDIFRHELWGCSDYSEPCIIRKFVNDAFFSPQEYRIGNIILYRWERNAPIEKISNYNTSSKNLDGYNFFDYFNLMKINKNNISISEDFINIDLEIKPLIQNKKKGFLILNPYVTGVDDSNNQIGLSLDKKLLLIPRKENDEIYKYSLFFDASKNNITNIDKIYVNMIYYDTTKETRLEFTQTQFRIY